MVFLATPVVRMARMLMPSTRQPMTWARFSVLRRFILTICLTEVRSATHLPNFHACD